MNFTPLDYNQYGQQNFLLAGLVGLLAWVVISIICLAVIHFTKKETEGNTIDSVFMSVGVLALFIAIGAGIFLNNQEANAVKHNKQAATENIMKKYDVKDVLWDNQQTKANPNLQPSWGNVGELVIEAHNGTKYLFNYELDTKTSEPTLTDRAIPGGSSERPEVSAESLLKK